MKIKSANPLIHLVYWIIVILTLTLVFGRSWGNSLAAFYFISMLLPIVLGTSYFFNYVLVANYYLKGRYIRFGLYTFYTIIISFYLELIVLMIAFIYLGNFGFQNLDPNAADTLTLAFVLYFLVFLGSFLLMTSQVRENQKTIEQLLRDKEKMATRYLEVMSNRRLTRIPYADIVYIESLADYIQVNSTSGKVISKEKISSIDERLPEMFIRIHRSFIVNRERIKHFSYEEVVVDNIPLTIGRSFRKTTREILVKADK
jgi:signal transduction histidine kinase